MASFRDELEDTLIEIGTAQIENGELESLEVSPISRELERRELIDVMHYFNRSSSDPLERVRLNEKGKEVFVAEVMESEERLSELASVIGIDEDELTEEKMRELLLMDYDATEEE